MSDHVDHAARAMDPDAFADRKPQRPSAELQWAARRKIATDHAEALDAAGLLVTPEHDASVRPRVSAAQRDRVADELWDQMVGVAKSQVREAMVDAFEEAGIEVDDHAGA